MTGEPFDWNSEEAIQSTLIAFLNFYGGIKRTPGVTGSARGDMDDQKDQQTTVLRLFEPLSMLTLCRRLEKYWK